MHFSKSVFVALLVGSASGNNSDLFNYGSDTIKEGGSKSYGQPDWEDVSCSSPGQCTGYPQQFPHAHFSIGTDNKCESCPESGSHNCGQHRQSPIDLHRDRGIDGHANEKECPDWHWMQYKDDTCEWDDMKDHFTIERHALQIHVPQLDNGDIDCVKAGQRKYPRLDYSKGFPDWWWMQRVDISVPSQHSQEGVQYAAEVTLAHFYEIEHDKNQLGHIALFLQDYDDAESWPFLDKLICQWRVEEEKARSKCSKDPAPPYGRCELFRGQTPTAAWLDEEAGRSFAKPQAPVPPVQAPVGAEPTKAPVKAPVSEEPTKAPVKAPVSEEPTKAPVKAPVSEEPTKAPVKAPVSEEPTQAPVKAPVSEEPTQAPVKAPVGVEPAEAPVQDYFTPPIIFQTVVMPTPPPSVEPTPEPTNEPSELIIEASVPAQIECDDYDVNYGRMCDSNSPCCESQRSGTSFCWESYDALGDAVESACYHCCDTPKIVGPATPELSSLPKTIQCSDIDNPFRLCKPDSCCTNPRSTSSFCVDRYATYGDDVMAQICQYCCSLPLELGPPENTRIRNLRSGREDADAADDGSLPHDETIPEGARLVYVKGKRYLLREESFEEEEEEEQVYFDRIFAEHQQRNLVGAHMENYEEIEWFPYEWMLKVGTEYYYRYEGTMLVPPCWDVVHWRPMKDPIRVHKRQIDELHRLLAWRIDPNSCDGDTAGVVSDDGNRIEVNREVQSYHTLHRKVFCECKDWPSKFDGDKEWCRNWKDDTDYDRFYTRPYSFETGGQWLPPL